MILFLNILHVGDAISLDILKSKFIVSLIAFSFHQQGSNTYCNLASTKNSFHTGSAESTSLLEGNQPQPKIHQVQVHKASFARSAELGDQPEGPQSNGGPSPPKYNRFEQLLKNLVGRKVLKETNPSTNATTTAKTTTSSSATTTQTSILHKQNVPLLLGTSAEVQIMRTPSEHTLIRKDSTLLASTTSLNQVQQRLWSVVPLLKRDGSSTSLYANKTSDRSGMRKCETVLALTHSTSNLEPMKPLNRLRSPSITCSRCSSLLSLAANSSRYSLHYLNGTNFDPSGTNDAANAIATTSTTSPSINSSRASLLSTAVCKLCLADVRPNKRTKLSQCGCEFCTEV